MMEPQDTTLAEFQDRLYTALTSERSEGIERLMLLVLKLMEKDDGPVALATLTALNKIISVRTEAGVQI